MYKTIPWADFTHTESETITFCKGLEGLTTIFNLVFIGLDVS